MLALSPGSKDCPSLLWETRRTHDWRMPLNDETPDAFQSRSQQYVVEILPTFSKSNGTC